MRYQLFIPQLGELHDLASEQDAESNKEYLMKSGMVCWIVSINDELFKQSN